FAFHPQQQFRVVPRQRARRAGQAHEGDHHPREAAGRIVLKVADWARRKAQRRMCRKMHGLAGWRTLPPYGSPLGFQPFQQPYRLEEVELIGMLKQLRRERAARQRPRQTGTVAALVAGRGINRLPQLVERVGNAPSSNWSPARGGHRFSSLVPCLVRTTSCVNELTDVYNARNRSITLANRNGLVPTYV